MIRLKTSKDLEGLTVSGIIASKILKEIKKDCRPGVSLKDLEGLAYSLFKKFRAKPSFLGYKPDKKSSPFSSCVCLSLNEQVVHGIPSDYCLCSGDILKIDLGVNFKGYFTDTAYTLGIGKISSKAKALIEAVFLALKKAISEAKINNHLGDIGFIIKKTIEQKGFFVIKKLIGHATGFSVHEEPLVLNFGQRGEGLKLQSGLVLAIEPMASLGKGEVIQRPDGSFATLDKGLTAHFEQTIAITKKGPKILTPFL